MKEESDVFKSLLQLGIAIALIPWSAYVATVTWGWFVVPLGVAAIGKAQAFGMMTMVGLMKSYDTEPDKESVTAKILVGALVPALILLFGYVAHSFMP